MLGSAIIGAKLASSAGSPLDDLVVPQLAEPDGRFEDPALPPARGAGRIAVEDFDRVALLGPTPGRAGWAV